MNTIVVPIRRYLLLILICFLPGCASINHVGKEKNVLNLNLNIQFAGETPQFFEKRKNLKKQLSDKSHDRAALLIKKFGLTADNDKKSDIRINITVNKISGYFHESGADIYGDTEVLVSEKNSYDEEWHYLQKAPNRLTGIQYPGGKVKFYAATGKRLYEKAVLNAISIQVIDILSQLYGHEFLVAYVKKHGFLHVERKAKVVLKEIPEEKLLATWHDILASRPGNRRILDFAFRAIVAECGRCLPAFLIELTKQSMAKKQYGNAVCAIKRLAVIDTEEHYDFVTENASKMIQANAETTFSTKVLEYLNGEGSYVPIYARRKCSWY